MHFEKLDRVLVALDLDGTGDDVLRVAMQLTALNSRCEVHLLHVIALMTEEQSVRGDPLAEWLARLPEPLPAGIRCHTTSAPSPARAIVNMAATVDADLIVVGTNGRRGVQRFLLGSVAEAVVRTAGCAVLIARPKAHGL